METLVLVLTDVQGSTRLWQDEPDAMDDAMRRHHEIVHAAVAEHGGFRPVDQGEGDAVFAAFRSAIDAVAAVVQVQRELAAEPWPTSVPLTVRIGVHLGGVTERAGNLYGDPVNRCARLRGLGHGGQTLLSAAVYQVVLDHLPAGTSLTDLGGHRMKDLVRPEHVWQLDVNGKPGDFPPLASLDRVLHNLPVQRSPLIGREDELVAVVDALRRSRLVTLTAFGGMGKTRLSIQAAAELVEGFPDGVWFVDLSSVTDPAEVPAAVARLVGASDGSEPSVFAALTGQQVLLLLDNLEQVMGCAPFISRLLDAAPTVRVLVTSRESLRVRGELEISLAPLALPPAWGSQDAASLGAYAAVQLFVDRAVAARADFAVTNDNAPALAAICQRLDGHPLAIELAAARVKMMSPQALLPRLDKALFVLTGGSRDMPGRHQTLRAAIAWSYDLLDQPERLLLDRMSVFPAPATFVAVEAICGEDIDVFAALASLVDKSLVRFLLAEGDDEDRYGFLVSIRDFAAEQVTDLPALQRRHHDHYTALVGGPPPRSNAEWVTRVALCAQETVHLSAAWELAQSLGDDAVAAFPGWWFWALLDLGELDRAARAALVVRERVTEPTVARAFALNLLAYLTEEFGVDLSPELSREDALAELVEASRVLGRADVRFLAQFMTLSADFSPEQILARSAILEDLAVRAEDDSAYSADRLQFLLNSAMTFGLQFLDRPRALARAEAGLAADPHDLISIANHATLLLNDGHLGQALELVQPFVDPADVPRHLVHAHGCAGIATRALVLLERPVEALAVLGRWQSLVDRRRWPLVTRLQAVGRAWALLELDRPEEALAALSAVSHLRLPGRPDVELVELRALRLAGRPRPAAEAAALADKIEECRWILVMPIYLGLRVEQAMGTEDPAKRAALVDSIETERNGLQLLYGSATDLERLLLERCCGEV